MHWAQELWLCCMCGISVCIIINTTNIQELRKTIPPPVPNIVGVSRHINCLTTTILVLGSWRFFISLVSLYKSLISLFLLSKVLILPSTYSLLFLQCLLASPLTLFRLPALLWSGSYNQHSLSASCDLKIVNILHKTMVYAASVHTDLDSL
jgi:hypothetical protein